MATKLPINVQWHITERCRNRCTHCYMYNLGEMHPQPKDCSLQDFQSIFANIERFEEIYQRKVSSFQITGGDPMCHPDFWRMMDFLHESKRNIRILGIPEQVSPENIRELKAVGVTSYQVSLDGLQQTHDAVRGVGSFEKTLDSIRILNEHKLDAGIMFTLGSHNVNELLPLIELLHSRDLTASFAFDFLVFTPTNNSQFSVIGKELVANIFANYRNLAIQYFQEGSSLRLGEKSHLFKAMKHDAIAGVEEIYDCYFASGCKCATSMLCIEPNGDVYPCRRLPINIGNLLRDECSELFLNHPTMRALRRYSNYAECADCIHVKICRGCPGVNFALTGSPFTAFPYCFMKKQATTPIQEISQDNTVEEELGFLEDNIANLLSKNMDSNDSFRKLVSHMRITK